MKSIGDYIVNASGYFLSAVMTNEILQTIALITSILGTLMIAVFRILDWYMRAKQDGKITEEEIKEGLKIAEEEGEKLINKDKEK